jgi:nitroreductase
VRAEDPNPVLDALATRRSVPRVDSEQPPRELIERVVAAGAWAPNHYHTAPWRFVVIAGDAREHLGDVMASSLLARLDDPDGPEAGQLADRERKKPVRAPVVIAVAAVPAELPKVVETEEISAVAAGVQNMLLAAHALGLGAMWRTGAPAYDPAVKRFLDLPEDAHIIAFVYIGYPELVGPGSPNRDAGRHTTWLGWTEA